MPRSPPIPLGLAALEDFPPEARRPTRPRSSPLVWADLSLRDREALRAFVRTSLVVLDSMPFILRCPLA